jgi:hypothetical protein
MAWQELERGSLEKAERYVVLAAEGSDSVPADRWARRWRSPSRGCGSPASGDLPAMAEQAQQLPAPRGKRQPGAVGGR